MILHSSELLGADEGEVFKSVHKSTQAADSARPTSRQGLWALRERHGTEVAGLLWGLGDINGGKMLQEAWPLRTSWDFC